MVTNKKSHSTLWLSLIILILVGVLAYDHFPYDLFSKKSKEVVETKPAEIDQVEPAKAEDIATATWDTYSDSAIGVSFKFPSYIQIGPNIKPGMTNANPTSLGHHEFSFTPDPNADFSTFHASVEFDGAKNFVLDLVQKFIAYDPDSNSWFVNKNPSDRPSVKNPSYRNLYLSSNIFSPPVYTKTLVEGNAFGPFMLGDESRGTKTYLVPIPSKGLVINFTVKYNDAALSGNTASVKALKAKFDKDFPLIVRSVSGLSN